MTHRVKFKLIFSIHKYIVKQYTVNISELKHQKCICDKKQKEPANLTFLGNNLRGYILFIYLIYPNSDKTIDVLLMRICMK